MPVLELRAGDQTLVATGDTALLEVYAALPPGLFPPFPPVELPGGLNGLLQRGGFGQTFVFASEVLGVTLRAPSGRVVRAGGRVVKNVQGYDLTRPFVGSFGVLGDALEVTLRLRPGASARHVMFPGSVDVPDTRARARFAWRAPDGMHLVHFGPAREVDAVLAGGTAVDRPRDYRPLFPSGMGVGEDGPLRDGRFAWRDGGAAPDVPPLFARIAAAL